MITKKKRIAICQSNYIPWKGYFELIRQSDVFVLFDEVQYTKNDWRNRNIIKTSRGLHWLTIPVNASTVQSIDQVSSVGNRWREKHWATLYHQYRKSSSFFDHAGELEKLYLQFNDTNLSQINYTFITSICKMLDISTPIIFSRQIPKHCTGKTERLIEIIQNLNGETYLSGEKAKSYLNVALMKQNGIEVEWMDYSKFEAYFQPYPPFNHHVSVIDLLLSQGLKANHYLLK